MGEAAAGAPAGAASDADIAALYDVQNPWAPAAHAGDAFFTGLVMAAASVLDVGCGTGQMLAHAREAGHRGRLVGVDPDRAALARARARRPDVEWVEARAADVADPGLGLCVDPGFDLAVMASHGFQLIVGDADIRASLTAVHAVLRPGGRFAFETMHPARRAWEEWAATPPQPVVGPDGRRWRVSWGVEAVEDDPGGRGTVVTVVEVTAPEGRPGAGRADRARMRFLDEADLDGLLTEAGFVVEVRMGDWDASPVTASSPRIVTVARRQ